MSSYNAVSMTETALALGGHQNDKSMLIYGHLQCAVILRSAYVNYVFVEKGNIFV